MPAECPVCHHDDHVQKLSVLVQSGVSTGTYSGPSGGLAYVDGKWGSVGGYTSLSGSSTTELARMLMPPPEPRRPAGFGWWWALILLFFGFAAADGLVVITTAPWMVVLMFPVGDSTISTAAILLSVAAVAVSLVLFGIGGLALLYRADRSKKRREEQKYATERPAWERAAAKWACLYFCHRDATIFDPETGAACEPQSLRQFLYA